MSIEDWYDNDLFGATGGATTTDITKEHKNRLGAYRLCMRGYCVVANRGKTYMCMRLDSNWSVTHGTRTQNHARMRGYGDQLIVAADVGKYMYHSSVFIDPRESIWPGKLYGRNAKRTNPQEILDAAPPVPGIEARIEAYTLIIDCSSVK